MAERVLAIWVIYRNPTDFPGWYVTRRQWVCKGGTIEIDDMPSAVTHNLEDARRAVPSDLTRLSRQPGDDPSIVETWL